MTYQLGQLKIRKPYKEKFFAKLLALVPQQSVPRLNLLCKLAHKVPFKTNIMLTSTIYSQQRDFFAGDT